MGGIAGARFRRLTGRAAADPAGDAARFARGQRALAVLDAHLAGRAWMVGESCTIADVSLFAYVHVADDAGFGLSAYPSVQEWLARVRALDGFVDDLAPYPANARPGAGRSIYD